MLNTLTPIVLTLILLTISKNGWIRVSPVAWDIISIYAISGSTLILVIAIYGVIHPAVEWNLVDCMLLTIAIILVSTLIYLVTNWLDSNKEDLGVASVKLCRMKTALCSLDSLPYSREWIRWLENEEDLQGNIKLVYDGCGDLKRFNLFSLRAGNKLNRANDLLVQADNFLHPKHELPGTMKFYKKMVINFIKNSKSELLGIWGMGSVGKTSLLKLLVGDFGSDYADDSFQVLLVRSGIQCTSVRQVQQAIATSMGLPLGRNETSQAQIIRDHLKDKSFLLLLDDLWEYLDLNAVGLPFPLGTVLNSFEERRTWCKVVFTSRYMNLCNQMGCGHSNTIQMKSFNEDDAWELLGRGWSVFSRVDAVKPQPDTVSAVKDKQDEGLSGGMTDNYEKVCSFIEAEDAQLVLMGIWGMRGVGKTTLLRLVHDSYAAAACFDHIMLVGAGTRDMVSNVQHAIAINLGLDWGMMSSLDELSRGKHILDHLEHKSFLLLLDDIREPLNWWAIGLPLLLHRRQKIILATRSQAACALMGCTEGNTMEMRRLGNDEAWKLFNDKVQVDDHPQLQHFAHKMVARCGGLPLALSALGRAMSSKRDPREWRCAYNQLTDMSLEPCEIDERVGVLILSPPWEKTSAQTEDTSLQEIAPSHDPYLIKRNVDTPNLEPGCRLGILRSLLCFFQGCLWSEEQEPMKITFNAGSVLVETNAAGTITTTGAGPVRVVKNAGSVGAEKNAGSVLVEKNAGSVVTVSTRGAGAVLACGVAAVPVCGAGAVSAWRPSSSITSLIVKKKKEITSLYSKKKKRDITPLSGY